MTLLTINYDLPKNNSTYLKRIGRKRTQNGTRNVSITLIVDEEIEKLKQLEKFYNTTIDELPENIYDIL